MENKFKVYYVAEFPVEQILSKGGDGFLTDPNHTRSRYQFQEAILEHTDNTFCEPVQITMRSETEVVAGPSGTTRLHALITKRSWTHIPAIVSTLITPPWLDTSVPVTTVEQYRSYYRLPPRDIGFETDGRAYHHNENPNKEQVLRTLEVSDATKERILAMLEEESKR